MIGRRFWWAPAVLVFISDLGIGLINGSGGIGLYSLLSIFLFCSASWLGSLAGGRIGLGRSRHSTFFLLWGGSLLCSLIFYLAANTFAWAAYPGYAKSLAGWIQCQTTGLPGFPPSWMFLRNMLFGDTLWCWVAGILWLSQELPANRHSESPAT